ncbi:PREDICTED: LOC110623756 isoform [Prunus dulcis]|uniref:PREDICTED: LOC110623756 isoform n=1 Tax=Prunus dulcis TaxID=3755 RepID=A0A5E4G9A3_PRUDU|nr:PREDICTED: LOC110623756 isoform [Prunus dulcis]
MYHLPSFASITVYEGLIHGSEKVQSPVYIHVRERSKIENGRESSVSGDSNKSFSSLITTCEVSREEIRARKIRIVALAALRHEMKLKGVRRSRSKTQTSWKTVSGSSETASFRSATTTESSCVSTSSCAASSARSQSRSRHPSWSAWNYRGASKLSMVREEPRKRKRLSFSAHMRRKAEEILKLLSGGCCFSEVKIRQTIGDSPDTINFRTKPFALRGKNVLTWRDVNGLLKLEKVKRSGIGGRYNPYIYTIA